MQAGRLRELVTIQEQTVIRNSFGEEAVTWVEIAKVWASVLPGGSGERFLGGASREQATVSHTVRIRYRGGLVPKMRLLWEGRLLDIESIIDPDGRRRELVLLCHEVVS